MCFLPGREAAEVWGLRGFPSPLVLRTPSSCCSRHAVLPRRKGVLRLAGVNRVGLVTPRLLMKGKAGSPPSLGVLRKRRNSSHRSKWRHAGRPALHPPASLNGCFKTFPAQANCHPSLCGPHPQHHGRGQVIQLSGQKHLQPSQRTQAQSLRHMVGENSSHQLYSDVYT